MMSIVLKINDLQVHHDKTAFLQVTDLQVNKGSSVAILGGNGAGKTTLLETILGLQKHNIGQVLWSEPKTNWGVQLQNSAYNKDYRVSDLVNLHSRLYQRTCPKMFIDFAILPLMKKKIGVLSRGEKQRVDLFIAMSHFPKVLVLDEPGTGLDNTYYQVMVNHINQLRTEQHSTIVMASHSPLELSFATDVVWMEKGKIKQSLPKQQFIRQNLGQRKVMMKFHQAEDSVLAMDALADTPPLLRVDNSPNEVLLYGDNKMAKAAMDYSSGKELARFVVADIEDADIFEFICTTRDKITQGGL